MNRSEDSGVLPPADIVSGAVPPDRHVSGLTLDDESVFHQEDSAAAVGSHQTLKQIADAACKRITVGTALMPLAGKEPAYAATVASEFSAVVIEHHLKWAPLLLYDEDQDDNNNNNDARLGRYDFTEADAMVDWARQHGLKVKGHCLVWHVTSPLALLQPLDPPQLRAALKQHIFTVMGHFRGRIRDWDVVNEALAPDGSIAENIFQQVLGNEYIADAFTWAHQADPEARLFYNDNKVEGIGTPKADALYNLVADLQAEGVPIHGVGVQAHFKGGGVGTQAVPTPRQVKQQIHRIGALGLVVHLSEVDVRVGTLQTEALQRAAQTQIYHDILAAALSEPATEAVYFWGFTDKYSWIHEFYNDAEEEAPLLWDTHYRRKHAYYAVQRALQTITPSGRVGGEGVLLDADVDVDGRVWGHTWRATELSNGDQPPVSGDDRPDWLQSTSNILPEYETQTEASTRAASNITTDDAADGIFNVDNEDDDIEDEDDDDDDDDTHDEMAATLEQLPKEIPELS